MTTPLDRALWLWKRGLSVIPVPFGAKVPILPWKDYQSRRPTEAELRRWFGRAPMNVAIITGTVSSVIVIDTDSAAAEQWAQSHLPPTLWRVSTSKGLHRYFRHPGQLVRNKARIYTADGRLQLDVRGDGGFVVGPGSTHATGHVYAALGDWRAALDELPVFDPAWIATPLSPPRSARTFTGHSTDALTRARAYLAAIPVPVIGQGSDAKTFEVACRLVRGFMLDEETTLVLLQEWAPAFDAWWLRRKVENAQAFGTEPVGGYLEAS
jgi:Bifunctional DNA primase/polymerase, N-terminal